MQWDRLLLSADGSARNRQCEDFASRADFVNVSGVVALDECADSFAEGIK